MPSFFGINEYKMDEKNRLFVPPYFKELLKAEKKKCFFVSAGLGKCLYLFLPSQWDALIAGNLNEFKTADKEEARAFKRFFFSNASMSALDGAGRILVDNDHRKYAGLVRDIVFVGVGNKAEIWDKAEWEKYKRLNIEPRKSKFARVYDI